MRRHLLIGLCVFLLGIPAAFSQGIALTNIDTGPYTPGSSISALLDIPNSTCIRPGNNFTLHLSDQNGDFSNETQIGVFQGFYTAFINGTIPANVAAGTGYRLRVKSTNPVLTSNSSAAFEIRAGTSLDARISSNSINAANPDVFGFCSGINNYTFYLDNKSAASTVNATVINELNKTIAAEIIFDNPVKEFTAQLAHYTVFVKAISSTGTVATRSYLIVNNRALTAFGTSGTNTVCLPNALLEFNVAVSGPDGIENNFPGNIYRVSWGDGSEDLVTICDIRNNNGKISHEYTVTSCGRTIVSGSSTVNNAFGINISSQNAYCGNVGTSVSTFAKVINKPKNEFSSAGACLNKPATFVNTSMPGEDPNSGTAGCNNSAVTYTWFVNGVAVPGAINQPKSYSLVYTFTTPGNHVVRLVSSTNTPCVSEPFEQIICVQEPPRPSFNLNGSNSGTTICSNTRIKPVNTSFTDNTCGTNTYNWRVIGGSFDYVNNTNAASAEPEIRFAQPGIYKIQLAIVSSACSTVITEEQTIVVNSSPTATLSSDVTLCNLSSYAFNNTTAGPTRTDFSGTTETLNGTYSWTVSGGAYAFIGNTDSNSKFPTIDFTEYGTYTVTVTHQNNCGSTSATQKLTFEPAPTVNAGTYAAICFRGEVNLNGSINGNVNSFEWIGGSGTFSPNRNALDAVYVPSQAERLAGQVNLTLRAFTALAAPCNVVEGYTTINIIGANTINSPASKTICTGSAVEYVPLATVEGSSFSWIVISSSSNVAGFNSGSGNRINDQLINTSATANAEVLYRITPSFEGCNGEPFDLRIIITPNPILSAQAASDNICSGQTSSITLNSNLTGTQYIWTSSASHPLITGQTESLTPSNVNQINDVLINKSPTAGTVTYTIRPISDNGCAGEAQTISIIVKASAENIISANQTICAGIAPEALTGNIPAGGDGPYTYQWQSSIDEGTTWANITGAESANYAPPVLQQTTAFRRLVNSFACPGSVINNSNIVLVTVNPDAKAEFSFLMDKGCAPFRLDASNITATAYPDRNGIYTWYANNTLIGTGLNFPGYTIIDPDQTVTIKLVVTSASGCREAEMSHDFGTQNILISRFTQNITENCGPTTVAFVNQSSSILNTTFFWDFGNGQTSTEAFPAPVSFSPDPFGADKTYTITLTASSACNTGVSYTSTVLVKRAPLSVFSPDKTIGCSPMQVTFSNTSPQTANTTYSFDFGDGSPVVVKNDRSSVGHIFTAGLEGNSYTVTMTATNGCGQHSSQHTIRVTPATVVAELVVNSNDQMGCAPFTVPFYNNSSGGTSYHYDFGDGKSLVTVSAPERIVHTYTAAGIYTVTLTASNGCSTVSTTEQIQVLGQPQTGFTYLGTPAVNSSLQFTNTTTDAVSYLWDFGDGTTSQEVNPTHIYAREGNYQVKLTAINYSNCESTSIQSIRVTAESGALFIPNSFIPNSQNPELREFKAKGFGIASYQLFIFNKWGEMLWETSKLIDDMPAEGWDGSYKGSVLPQGVYFWRMEAVFKNGQVWKGMSYDNAPPKTTGVLNLIR